MNPTVFLVDDDDAVREALTQVLEGAGFPVQAFASGEAFLGRCGVGERGCAVLDVRMPGLTGPELQAALAARKVEMPLIFLTGHGDVAGSVRALKAGALDFLEKPAPAALLIDRVRSALGLERERYEARQAAAAARAQLERLTGRERQILNEIAAGRSSKAIARRLGISHRTVDVHRAHIVQKTGVRSPLELARFADAVASAAQSPQGSAPKRSSKARGR